MIIVFSMYAARFFRTLSYVFSALLWLWLLMLLMPSLLESDAIQFLTPDTSQTTQSEVISGPSSPILLAIGGAVTIVMLIVTVVILVRLPGTLTKTGHTATEKISERIVPVLTHHQKIPKKKRQALTARTIVYIRLLLIVLPVFGIYIAPALQNADGAIGILVGCTLAGVAAVSLLAEYFFAFLNKSRKA